MKIKQHCPLMMNTLADERPRKRKATDKGGNSEKAARKFDGCFLCRDRSHIKKDCPLLALAKESDKIKELLKK